MRRSDIVGKTIANVVLSDEDDGIDAPLPRRPTHRLHRRDLPRPRRGRRAGRNRHLPTEGRPPMTTTTTTPNLELVPTYRLVDKPCARRTFELGMRWWPPCRDQPPDTKGEAIPHRGFSALRSLKDGDSLNEERLDAAVAYLDAALDYFRHRPPDGFMPADECRSAIVELTELRDYLR